MRPFCIIEFDRPFIEIPIEDKGMFIDNGYTVIHEDSPEKTE